MAKGRVLCVRLVCVHCDQRDMLISPRRPGQLHRMHNLKSAHASLGYFKSLGLTTQRRKHEAKSLGKPFSSWDGRLVAILRLKLETLEAISNIFVAMRQK